jgi:hypothetical protein
LFQNTVLRAWRKVVVGFSGNGDYALFLIVDIAGGCRPFDRNI